MKRGVCCTFFFCLEKVLRQREVLTPFFSLLSVLFFKVCPSGRYYKERVGTLYQDETALTFPPGVSGISHRASISRYIRPWMELLCACLPGLGYRTVATIRV